MEKGSISIDFETKKTLYKLTVFAGYYLKYLALNTSQSR